MADKKPILPEVPGPADAAVEKNEAKIEMTEKGFETVIEIERKDDGARAMRDRIEQSGAKGSSVGQSQAPALDADVQKEKIISKFSKAVLAAGIDTAEAQKIIEGMEQKYLKNFPDIVDAIHDRVTEDRDRR